MDAQGNSVDFYATRNSLNFNDFYIDKENLFCLLEMGPESLTQQIYDEFEEDPDTEVVLIKAARLSDDWEFYLYLIGANQWFIKIHVGNNQFHLRRLLQLSGDVEANPGPTQSKFLTPEMKLQHHNEIKALKKQVVSLKKAAVKHNNHIQRSLELEKRSRKKNRYAQSLTTPLRSAQGIVNFCTNTGTAMQHAAEGIGPTLNMAQDVLKHLLSAGDSLKAMFCIPNEVDFIGILVSLISVCNSFMDKSLFSLTMHCANLGRLLGITLDKLLTMLPRDPPIIDSKIAEGVFYSGESVDEVPLRVGESLITEMLSNAAHSQLLPITGMLALFSGVFSLLCTGTVPNSTSMTKHFTSIGRAANGFKSIKDMFTWITDYISEIYYTTVHGMTYEQYSLVQEYPALENICAAAEIIKDLSRCQINASADLANQILSIKKELDSFGIKASKCRYNTMTKLLLAIEKKIKSQISFATNCPARNHAIRATPTAIYLYGKPGTGKSILTEVLCAKMYNELLQDDKVNYASLTFIRKAVNEFWEGYVNQPIVILDDFANAVDSVTRPVVEYAEIVSMVNNTTYPLHMAEKDAKADTFFNSPYIIASSNQKVPDIKSLADPGSVTRRFSIYAEITIDSNYGKEVAHPSGAYTQYDESIARKYVESKNHLEWDEDNPLRVEHYHINIYKVTGKNTVTNPVLDKQGLGFEEFWDYCKEIILSKTKHSRKVQKGIHKMAGVDTTDDSVKTAEIMQKFKSIFDPEVFLEEMSSIPPVGTPEEKEKEEFTDAEDETLLDAGYVFELDDPVQKISYRTHYSELFATLKETIRSGLTRMTRKLAKCKSFISNKLGTVARFIMSFFSNITNRASTYIESIPNIHILAGLGTTILAVVGLWCTGLFRAKPSDGDNPWCKFSITPSPHLAPCRKCDPCQVMAYPTIGDMLDHYCSRIGVKQVRKELVSLGMEEEALLQMSSTLWEKKCANLIAVSQARIYDNQPVNARTSAYAQALIGGCPMKGLCNKFTTVDNYKDACNIIGSTCWYNCSFCPNLATDYIPTVEGTINGANSILSKGHLVAQAKVYDTKDFPIERYANSKRGNLIEAKTDIQIGSTIYAQRDRVQVEQTTQVLLNNAVWILAVDENNIASQSNGIFLVGRTLITTAHTVINTMHESPIKYIQIFNPYTDTPTITVPYKDCSITQMKQKDNTLVDLALISFPSCVPNRPKILSKFINASDIDMLKEGDLVFSGFNQVNGTTIVQESHPNSFQVSVKETEYLRHASGKCPLKTQICSCEHIKIGNHVNYDLETSAGMCGSLLSVSNRLVHTKLIGVHVAGGNGVNGLGVLTTRQLLEDNLNKHIEEFEVPPRYLIDGRMPYSQSYVDVYKQPGLITKGDCIAVGTATAVNAPTQTQLQPSAVFDQIQQHITKPAHLRSFVKDDKVIDPMELGILKVLGPQTYVDPQILDAAVNDVFNIIGKGDTTVLTYEEAIQGIEGNSYIRPINRTTSPGYPYNLNNPSKGKTHWLGSGEEYDLTNTELRADFDKLEKDSSEYIRGEAISIATLKDEKRPFSKVDLGKTRVFEACPQHLVLAIRKYYLSFVAHIMKNRIDNEICVGINPYSLEWTKLAHKLQEQGDNVIAGDFSNFDGSLSLQIVYRIGEKINEWYGDDSYNQATRITLWEHICNADVLVRGDVIRQTHSQPSGNPLTVIVNSIFNSIVMRMAYIQLKIDQGLSPRCDFTKYVANANYGDDNLLSINHRVLDWYNQETITVALSKFGLTYTDETKSGQLTKCRKLVDVAFLKRKFVIQPDGTFMAPMDLSNTLEITNWIRGKAIRLATKENCACALMELSLHSMAIYNQYSQLIKDACQNAGIYLECPTYWEWMAEYRINRDSYAASPYTPLW